MLGKTEIDAKASPGGRHTVRSARRANRYYQGPVSDHFDGEIFFNPGGEAPRGFADLLRWQFGGGRAKWPRVLAKPVSAGKAGRADRRRRACA